MDGLHVRHTHGSGKIVGYLVSQKGIIRIIGKQYPVLAGTHTKKIG